MEIRVVDFDVLTRKYKNYQDGVAEIKKVRKEFIDNIEPLKKEMEEIINSVSSGLILDRKTQKEKEDAFKELQERAVKIDNDFKTTMRDMQADLNKKTFDELSVIITEWSKSNSVDLVIGKMEVVFLTERYEATEHIVSILKEKDLYTETVEVVEAEA